MTRLLVGTVSLFLCTFGLAQPPRVLLPAIPAQPEKKAGDVPAPPAQHKLGRAKPVKQYDYGNFRAIVGQDGKTRYFPKLGRAVDTSRRAVALPDAIDWSIKAPTVLKRMYLNDRYGCCVLSSRYHQIGIQTASDTGTGLEADDAEVYTAYQNACGRGDNGCDMSAVNLYQQKTGLKVKGTVHKSDGSVFIDNTNKDLVKAGIVVFGGLNVGMSLPRDWYTSADGSVWDVTKSAIVGGHEVQAYGYDKDYVFISTWGGTRKITWAAFTSHQWIDELYTTLSADWYGSDRLAPNGISADALKADLALVANGEIPPLPGPSPTPPGPTPVPPTPTPGVGYTGTIAKITTYQNGVEVSTITVVGGGGGTAGSTIEKELKDAGVSPAIIADVLQLLVDLKTKPIDRNKVFADVLKIIVDLGGLPVEPKDSDDPPNC